MMSEDAPQRTPPKNIPINRDQFLVSESMLTPGICGALTMLMTNTLCNNIGAFNTLDGEIGLILSALFALLVTVGVMQIWKKVVYYLMNTMFIFCTAFGATTAASGGLAAGTNGESISILGISSSYAQTVVVAQATPQRTSEINEEITRLVSESAELRNKLEYAQNDQERQQISVRLDEISRKLVQLNAQLTASSQTKKPFFRQWKF